MARLSRPQLLLPVCILLGVVFDFLFWAKPWGISFTLFTLLAAAAGLWQAARLRLQPARVSWPLVAAALLLAAVSALRAEPFTLFVTRAAALVLLMLFAASFLVGDWWRYRFSDYLLRLLGLVPGGLLAARRQAPQPKRGKAAGWRAALPALRGALLALPVLFVLAGLLASADAYFAQWLSGLFGFIRLERLPEYVFRLVLIVIVAYALFGSYMYAFLRSKEPTTSKDLVKPFIGFTEAMIVLASVAALFSAFVAIQFRYFFGGASNVLGPNGLTYAEYARQGFAELVLVALVTLALFIGLSALTQRKPAQRRYFSSVGVVLFALVAVILASAFQRLLLYEEAYAFTRLRTIPHVFMVWLGLLLLALVALEVAQRQRFFALAVFCAALGFVATFPLLNLDAFIARSNVQREIAKGSQAAGGFDFAYLQGLSTDAVPALADAFRQAQAQGETGLASQIAMALMCNALTQDEYRPLPDWQAWNSSRAEARRTWLALRSDASFPRLQSGSERGTPFVWLQGEQHYCLGEAWD